MDLNISSEWQYFSTALGQMILLKECIKKITARSWMK